MAHQRFRKYNTKGFWKGQNLDNDLCMVVRAGNMVFVRGQTGFDLNGKLHGIGDPAKQAEVAMKCLKTLLEEAGSRLRDVGERARAGIEAMLDRRVFLSLRVKVAKEWQRDAKQLGRLGF